MVQHVCLFMHDPREPHFLALSESCVYLHGTLHHGLYIRLSHVDPLVSYFDVDVAGCPLKRRSTSGLYVYLSDNLVPWSSKRQHVVSRSVPKAEYQVS